MGITRTKEQVRDGFFGDLPEELQTKLMNIHKLIKDTVNDLIENDNYRDLKSSNWAMSCINDFCVMPKDKSEIGSVRVYKKGKTYRCMIQATGHFRNHQYGWIEELLHDFICNVYSAVRPKIRKKYDITITNEGRTGEPFEGFDIYPNPKTVPELWEKFEGRKTKAITESSDVMLIECSQDLLDYYESYGHISYDQFFLEKSHGKLNYEFRFVIGEHNGHLYKIVYNLNPDNITSDNVDTSKEALDNIRKDIRKKGHSNYTSQGNTVLAIVDMCNNQNVKSVSAFPPIHNIGGNIMPTSVSGYMSILKRFITDKNKLAEEEEKLKKECPSGIAPSLSFPAAIESSKEQGQKAIEYKVGEVDNTMTYKSTSVGKVLDGMLNIRKSKFSESATNTPEYNVDMTEIEAKRVLRTLSQGIINDIAGNKKDYKVSQYTANIYANIITKNLLPLWSKGYKKISINLDSYQSFCTFEFKTPNMSQDFVSRFVAGRESIGGFLHRQPEIKIKMSPRIFHTMKNPDDAYNFFKAAIRYYDAALERYSSKLMVEVMKLNHDMKHLISTTKMSGIVTLPMSLLFVFDDVKMDNKDTFRITQDDIKTINTFIHNIYTKYASPEKEKKKIVEDVKEVVKAMRESCGNTNENIRQLCYLPEAVEMYLFEGFADEISKSNRNWIYEQLDTDWSNRPKNPEIAYLQESFGVKKLKKIPNDLVAYITIETESIKDSNDKMMISSYCLGKIEIVEWYIELLEVGSKKYIVPHTKPYLETVRTQLLACFKKIMDTPIPKKDRPLISIQYPQGYEG